MRAKFLIEPHHSFLLTAAVAFQPPPPTIPAMPSLARLCLVLLAAASSLCAQEAKTLLRTDWQPGKNFRLETSTETSTRTPGTNSEQTMRTLQITDLQVRADPATGHRLVKSTFASIKGELGANGKTLSYDSSKPGETDELLQQMFGRSLGKSFVLVYDDKNRFTDVRGLGDLASQAGAVTSLSAIADSRDVANLFRKSLEMGLPPVPVGPGDTWSSDESITFPQAGEVAVQMNGKMDSIVDREGRPHAKIIFEGKFGNSQPTIDRPIPLVEIASGSSISGILFFDLQRKVVSFGTYTSTIRLQTPEMTVPFTQKVTTKMAAMVEKK